jgi:hypothetical protein
MDTGQLTRAVIDRRCRARRIDRGFPLFHTLFQFVAIGPQARPARLCGIRRNLKTIALRTRW